MKIQLYKRTYNFNAAWNVEDSILLSGTCTFNLYLTWKYPFFWFNVNTNTFSSSGNNPIKVLMDVIEHTHIGWLKYQALKERTRTLKLWQQL